MFVFVKKKKTNIAKTQKIMYKNYTNYKMIRWDKVRVDSP